MKHTILFMIHEVWEFFKVNFDKLLLAGLFIYLTILVIHMTHDTTSDAAAVHWAREQANLVVGALLGLITGRAMQSGKNGGGSNAVQSGSQIPAIDNQGPQEGGAGQAGSAGGS